MQAPRRASDSADGYQSSDTEDDARNESNGQTDVLDFRIRAESWSKDKTLGIMAELMTQSRTALTGGQAFIDPYSRLEKVYPSQKWQLPI